MAIGGELFGDVSGLLWGSSDGISSLLIRSVIYNGLTEANSVFKAVHTSPSRGEHTNASANALESPEVCALCRLSSSRSSIGKDMAGSRE